MFEKRSNMELNGGISGKPGLITRDYLALARWNCFLKLLFTKPWPVTVRQCYLSHSHAYLFGLVTKDHAMWSTKKGARGRWEICNEHQRSPVLHPRSHSSGSLSRPPIELRELSRRRSVFRCCKNPMTAKHKTHCSTHWDTNLPASPQRSLSSKMRMEMIKTTTIHEATFVPLEENNGCCF